MVDGGWLGRSTGCKIPYLLTTIYSLPIKRVRHILFRIECENFSGSISEFWERAKDGDVDILQFSIFPYLLQYREYLVGLSEVDLNEEGGNVRTFSSLLLWKSSLLLPLSFPVVEEDEEPGLWEEREKEYGKIIKLAEVLRFREEKEKDYFLAGFWEGEEEEMLEIGVVELMEAFSHVLQSLSKQEVMEVVGESHTVEDKIDLILEHLANRKRVKFFSFFLKAENKLEMVVTFLALLELVKRRVIRVYQRVPFGEILVRRLEPLSVHE